MDYENICNLELFYNLKEKYKESIIPVKNIEDSFLSVLEMRNLLTEEMFKSGINIDELFNSELNEVISKAVNKLFYVTENNLIEISAYYNDTNEFLLETVYEERNNIDLEALLKDKICDAFQDQIWEMEDSIVKEIGISDSGFRDIVIDHFYELFSIELPFDHFLNQNMKVNIMLTTDYEQNRDCISIHEQYLAMCDPANVWDPVNIFEQETGLSFLLKQQGYTINDLIELFKEYDNFFYEDGYLKKDLPDKAYDIFKENHNIFLTSICQELENQRYYMGVLTVLADMSINDFILMQRGNSEITFTKDAMIGIFNPWNGSGSCLEIELEKDLIFGSDMIRDIQIEGVKPPFEYTVNDTFGLIGSCWKEPVVESFGPVDKNIANTFSLDKLITDADNEKLNNNIINGTRKNIEPVL